MSTRNHPLGFFPPYIVILSLTALSALIPSTLLAKDLPQKTEVIKLPADGALDSEGKPLAIPKNPNSALNYNASQTHDKKRREKQTTKKPKNKPTKQLSRKQQLASRQHVANDPSCRWLDKRMSHLEKSLKRQQKQEYGYQDKELRARQSEWVCMKCGAEGPSQSDHHNCQYRR